MKRLLFILFFLFCIRSVAQTRTASPGETVLGITFPSGCSYTWTNDNTGIGLAASGTGDIAEFTATNNTTSPIEATVIGISNTPGGTCVLITIKITVNPPAVITPSGTLVAMSTDYGKASDPVFFLLSAKWLTSLITLKAPVGFEIGTKVNGEYSWNTTFQIGQKYTGTLNDEKIYVRLAPHTNAGIYSGDIILTANTANTVTVPIPPSEVKRIPLTIKTDDKTRVYGEANPIFTASYSGFVYNETPSVLTTLPTITTIADAKSPAGKYPIIINGAVANNYTFNYINALLTVLPAPVFDQNGLSKIPNTFTPNGDGINDTWKISNTNTDVIYTVNVFNRYGQQVFFSKGNTVIWNGQYNSKDAPTGVYYYVVSANTKGSSITGSLTLIR
jgi:gliding motility-associated-like protein